MDFTIGIVLTLIAAVSALPVNPTGSQNNGKPEGQLKRTARSVECQAPENITQLFENLNNNIDSTMFLRHVRGPQTHFLPHELNINNALASFYYGPKHCPTDASSDPDAPLWERSLCPWYYNITDLPAGHYPSVLPQAICRCDNCISANANQCERVSTSIRVLVETGCQDGFYTYRPETVTHYVGCTCAKRRLAAADPDEGCPPFGCPT